MSSPVVAPHRARSPKGDGLRTFFDAPATRVLVLVLVFAWGAYQSFWLLDAAAVQVDEPIYVDAGAQYLEGDFAPNREHPPTAKYLMGLAQLVLGDGLTAGRVVPAAVVVLGGIVTFLWLRREIGWYGGLVAAGAWMTTPRGIAGDPVRIDRLALLDPVMVFFAVAALAAAWTWMRTGRWPWVALAGALMALSVTSKVSTAVVLPAFLLLPLLHRRWRDALVGGLIFVASFAVVFVVAWAPMGLVSAITYMLDFQGEHAAAGHWVSVAGERYRFPPWWADLYFQVAGTGVLLTAVLAAGVVLALVLRPDRLVAYIGSVAVLLLAFYLVFSAISLPAYYYAWMWPVTALAAIGYARAFQAGRPLLLRLLSVALVLVLAFCSARLSVSVAAQEPRGIALVESTLEDAGLDAPHVLTGQLRPLTVEVYLGDEASADPADGPFDALLLGTDSRFPLDDELRALLDEAPDEFERVQIDDVVLYLPDGELVRTGDGFDVVPQG
ncbi:ArnT family glycosyltransferase [Frigoribacterium salinisoli]